MGGEVCLESYEPLKDFLRRDFFHGSFLSRSIQELRLSADWEATAHKGLDDLGKSGLFLIKDHRCLIIESLDIPHQVIRENSFLRFQDKPYPVTGVPSPAGRGNVNSQEYGLVVSRDCCRRQQLHQ